MLVTDDGISRLANELHPSKGPSSMLMTDDGMLIDFTFALIFRGQSCSERRVVSSGMTTVTLANELHSLKALYPMMVTDDGISRLANELHPLKASAPMLVTDDGISRLANKLHL